MSLRRLIAVPMSAALAAGCVSVDPRGDYDRVAGHIGDAIGRHEVYRPGDDEASARRVAEILEGGLTCDEAVQVCLLNNRRLQAAFFNVGMARADVVQSGLLSNPSLGVSLRLPAGGGLANLEAGLAQNIADLWQIPVRRRGAQRELDRAIVELARTACNLSSETRAAYYRAVAADLLKVISHENLDIVRKLVDIAVARQEAGAGTEVDVNLSRSELSEMELAARRAELAGYETRAALAALLGLVTPPETLDLTEALPDVPQGTARAGQLLTIALMYRLDIKAAEEAVAAAEARLREEGLRVIPSFEIGVSLERGERPRSRGRKFLAETARATAGAGALTLPSIGPREGKDNDFIIGPSISLEVPILDQNQAQIAKAEYAFRQAAKLHEALVRDVSQETRLASQRARAAWDNDVFYRDHVLPLRRGGLELAREAYRAGRTPFLSVLETQRTLLAARAAYIEARQRSAVTLAALERVTGRPIEWILDILRSDSMKTTDDEHPITPDYSEVDGSETPEGRS